MGKIQKVLFICGFTTLSLFLVLLTFSSPSWSVPPTKDLKVGVIVPLSGPGAPWGIPLKSGFEIAFDEMNAAGGIKTSEAIYRPKLYAEDDQYKAELAVTKLNKLLYKDRIDPIVYALSGSSVLAMQAITTPKKIILTMCGQVFYDPQKNPYTFRSTTFTYFYYQVTYEWLKKNEPQIRNVLLLHPDYASGHDHAGMFREIAKIYGFNFISEEYFPMATTDFNPILTKVLPKKPDFLSIGPTAPGSSALIVKQARELGYKGPIYGGARQDIQTILDVAGPDYANNFYVNTLVPGAPGLPPKFKGLYDEYVKRHSKFLDVCVLGHRTAYEIKAAVELADGTESERLAEAYRKIKIDSVEGPVHFGPPFGTQAYYPVPMTRIEGGKAKMLGLFDPKVLTEADYLALAKK